MVYASPHRLEDRSPEGVFLLAPMGVRLPDPDLYETAFDFVKVLHPAEPVIADKTLWVSTAHWHATWHEVLEGATRAYILVGPGGCVGRGIVDESLYLKEHGVTVVALIPDFEHRADSFASDADSLGKVFFEEIEEPTWLIVDEEDYTDYAVLAPSREEQ